MVSELNPASSGSGLNPCLGQVQSSWARHFSSLIVPLLTHMYKIMGTRLVNLMLKVTCNGSASLSGGEEILLGPSCY